MKFRIFFFAFILLFLTSCSRDKRIDEYNQIVENADKISYFTRVNDTFILTKEVDSIPYLQSQKDILTRNITPEFPRKFIAKYKIELYSRGVLLGKLLIGGLNENPCVNFTTEKFGFTFGLTYGIGMSL